jgi:predicted RNase H-like HicB family nuclease
MMTFSAYIEYDPETKLFAGVVPGISGAHSQGATLDELKTNLTEVLELLIEESKERGEFENPPRFVGLQQIEISV